MKINFGHPNPLLKEQGFEDLPIQADLTQGLKTLTTSVKQVLLDRFPDLPNGQVTLALPGASILCAAVITAVHALTGCFPVVVPLLRDETGAFVPQAACDLQAVRTALRAVRTEDTVIV